MTSDKDRVSPCSRVSQADQGTLGVESETLASFGSRVLTALQLTIWSGSVDVILERRAWRMSVQKNNILPDD